MPKKYYGYARVSTRKQSLTRQVENIEAAYPTAFVFAEMYTGTKIDRPEWNKLYKRVKDDIAKGNHVTLIFDEASRMSRNADEAIQVYDELYGLGVDLVFLKTPQINSETYKAAVKKQITVEQVDDPETNKLVQTVIDAINEYIVELSHRQIRQAFKEAEDEVEYLHKRVSEGLRVAKAQGKRVGNIEKRKLITKKSIECKATIKKKSKNFDGTINDKDLIKILGISHNTFYKYKREIFDDIANM